MYLYYLAGSFFLFSWLPFLEYLISYMLLIGDSDDRQADVLSDVGIDSSDGFK